MWIRQNVDGSYTICNSFSYWDGFKVVNITVNSDKRKNNAGFSWESDEDVLNSYNSINAEIFKSDL